MKRKYYIKDGGIVMIDETSLPGRDFISIDTYLSVDPERLEEFVIFFNERYNTNISCGENYLSLIANNANDVTILKENFETGSKDFLEL